MPFDYYFIYCDFYIFWVNGFAGSIKLSNGGGCAGVIDLIYLGSDGISDDDNNIYIVMYMIVITMIANIQSLNNQYSSPKFHNE